VKLVQASLCRLLACSLRRSISDVLLR
jgi:hypothetical protein